jgi:hypothetical protein
MAVLCSNTQYEQQPQLPRVVQAFTVIEGKRVPPSLKAQPTSTESVQASNANSSSLNMLEVVLTIFQHTITELSGAEPEEGRIMATKM